MKFKRVYRGVVGPLPGSRMSTRPIEAFRREGVLARLYTLYLSTVLAVYAGLVTASLVRKFNLDVILERETSFGAGAIASLITRRPLVLEVNGPRFSPISLRRASKITTYSMSMLPKGNEARTVVVDAGVDTDMFREDQTSRSRTRSQLGVADEPVVGYVGTFQAWHGVLDLVRAGETLLKEFPRVKFLMVGPGYGEAQSLTEKLGVGSAYLFVGGVSYDQVPDYLNAADILVSPTNPALSPWTKRHGPPQQFKVFEYMACGKPVVVADVGPMRRIVQSGVNGLTFRPGDVLGLANALRVLLANPRLARTLGDEGSRFVKENFSWSAHSRGLESLLAECVKSSPTAQKSRVRFSPGPRIEN